MLLVKLFHVIHGLDAGLVPGSQYLIRILEITGISIQSRAGACFLYELLIKAKCL